MKAVLAIVLCAFSAVGCGTRTSSEMKNIYKEDQDGVRRRDAKAEEMRYALSFGGCTYSLIAQNYAITAAHCSEESGALGTSGAAMAAGQKEAKDVQLDSLIESGLGSDYKIYKIKWTSKKYMKAQHIWTKFALKKSAVKLSIKPAKGDAVSTVGFPYDGEGQAIVSTGFLKKVSNYIVDPYSEIEGSGLYFNAGITGGNSGGPLFRASDETLLGLTVSGDTPSYYSPNRPESSWSADENDVWNIATPIWVVHEKSQAFRSIVQGGTP
ncbi:MAG: trypsin-like serine protease [Proteobacteria bacterium]|nr:MAG: trypsin-like serine protease [Pseudomonadota bacterium]